MWKQISFDLFLCSFVKIVWKSVNYWQRKIALFEWKECVVESCWWSGRLVGSDRVSTCDGQLMILFSSQCRRNDEDWMTLARSQALHCHSHSPSPLTPTFTPPPLTASLASYALGFRLLKTYCILIADSRTSFRRYLRRHYALKDGSTSNYRTRRPPSLFQHSLYSGQFYNMTFYSFRSFWRF